jgi:hypothetical protein
MHHSHALRCSQCSRKFEWAQFSERPVGVGAVSVAMSVAEVQGSKALAPRQLGNRSERRQVSKAHPAHAARACALEWDRARTWATGTRCRASRCRTCYRTVTLSLSFFARPRRLQLPHPTRILAAPRFFGEGCTAAVGSFATPPFQMATATGFPKSVWGVGLQRPRVRQWLFMSGWWWWWWSCGVIL